MAGLGLEGAKMWEGTVGGLDGQEGGKDAQLSLWGSE